MKIVLVTGGFDPLHSGHIAYFEAAKKLGDRLIVGVNSDAWLERKKGRSFMKIDERTTIIQNLRMVDGCVLFDDNDGSSCEAIRNVRQMYPDAHIVFANGGDRTSRNIPEMTVEDHNLVFAFGVGGDNKKNSSSWILEEWKTPKTARPWGYYRVIHDPSTNLKVKELTVDPGCKLSMQRHERRAEFWFIAEGMATVYGIDNATDVELVGRFAQNQSLWIERGQWHQLTNERSQPLRVIEIQYGEDCVEEDIERLS
jgi:D-beta-D-heptose 7-phosphate kinase/D-beta-D-heptose 1-phosphate adenosyltransferase